MNCLRSEMDDATAPRAASPILNGARQWAASALVLVLSAVAAYGADSRSPLADAVERMDRPGIRALLEQHVDVNAAQVDGMTALHWAAYRDDAGTAAPQENHYLTAVR